MNTNLNLDRIGKCLDAYERHAGNEERQYGFSVAMMREVYPEEESFDIAARRFFGVYGKNHRDVYGYFRKLYDDAKNPSQDASAFANNSQGVSAEKSNEIIKSNSWLGFQNFTKRVSPEIRETAFRIVYAEGSRTDIAEAWADKLLSMPEDDRNAVLWGAHILSPEKSANFLQRVGTRVLENLGDNVFNIDSYLEASQKGVNPHTIFDAVNELGAIGENGKIKPDKLEELNKRLNALRAENSMSNSESSQVYGEKIRNAVRRGTWVADKKEYTADFIEKEYAKAKRYKDAFKLASQIREIKRSNFGKQGAVAQTIEDATVVGVEMLKYLGASALGAAVFKNPYASATLVGAVMYSEFKPQMFNALRHEGNMSVKDANKYANFSTAAMVAANYVGYTSWIKAVKPSSYLLGTKISEANARDYFFHAIKEMPKNFVRQGGTETISEYMESVAELATKLWAADHADATFNEKQLWENFRQDFIDTSRIMPTLMLGSTFLGGGLAINKVRMDSGAGWNLKKLIAPSDAVNHTVQARAAYAQAEAAAREAAEKLGGSEQSIDFVQKYQNAKTDAERAKLFEESFNTDEERENARALLENIDKFDGEIQKAFANILADAAKANARETEELDRKAQDIAVFNEVEEDSDGVKKFAIVETLLDKLGARGDVIMVNSPADLEQLGFSPETAQEIFSQAAKKGFYSDQNDKVYMILSHFKDGVDAFRTFVHERGHWVAQRLRNNPEYNGMLSTIVQLTGGEENLRALLPAAYAREDASSLAEEYLMRVVERVAMEEVLNANQKGVWNFFKSKFKKWFGSDRTFASIADKQIAEIARDIYRRAVGEKPIYSNYWESSTPENNARKVSGHWEILDASELITSTDKGYDDTLQPRNRTRMGSVIQTSEIAAYLDPTRLDSDTTTDKGAPIIDSRKMVVSGNGRTLAIREAYGSENNERSSAYRKFVFRRAGELGIDVDSNIKNPVLVRIVDNLGDMTLADFAARSNKSQVAAMSNAENAIADARRILDAHLLDIFFPSESGDVLAASNNDFISRFIGIIGNREEYIDKHGNRKPNLAPRIKAAVLAATLNPEKRDIIEDLLDNPQGWSGLINGLLGSVANIAKLDGNPDYSLSKELSEAVEIYVGLQRNGESVATFNAQEDFLRPQISEEVGFLTELFEKNSRTSTGISGVLNEYYNLVKNIDTTTQDMFGAENPPKIERLRTAYKNYATDLAQGQEANARWKIDDPTSERVEKLKNAKSIEIGENSYEGLYELNAKSAREYVLKELRGKEYINADTGDKIEISQVGARKLLSHDRYNEDYLRSFAAIPQMIENSIFLGEEPNEKGKDKYDKYRYYACGLKIGSRDYTARLTIGESEGKWYYDQALTQIEKGDLIKRLLTLNSRVRPLTESPNGFIDNRLISLLQENSSKKWREADARRFASELQDFIDGKLDNKHVFRLGTTPEVLRLLGVEDLPIEMAASTLARKLSEHSELSAEDLKFLPHEIANPIAVFESSTIPNAFVVLTEITASNGKPVVAAIHCEKEIKRRNINVNDVRSVHSRNISQLDSAIRRKELRYINRKRIPSYLRLPLVQFHGRNLDRNVSPTIEKVLTESDLSQEELNSFSDLKWREVSEPSPEEIAEANRQKAEVKAKWTNPDGSMKKGYMLAPNGRPTNLTEDQWLQVRTPNFKKWFGDWEKEAWAKAAVEFLESTAPVANLTGQEFQKDGVRLTDKVSAYFNSIGNVAHNEELGDVILNLEGIRDSIAHGVGRQKAAAFMAVKDVIEKGFIFNRETNWKNRNYDSAVIIAPISINNTDYICEVVITRKPNENRFYLHEVEIKETLEKAFKTPTEGRASQASKLIIGKHLEEVKGNVSKVVDENGEPLVVYHGSTAMFNEFRSKFIGHSTGTADGRGFYFTTDKSYAEGFKSKDGRVIEAFLNIRDLLDYKKKTITKAALKKIIKEIDRAEFEADGEHYFISNFGNYYDEGIDKVIDEATESNYDFCDTDVEIFNVLITSGADFDLTAKAIKNVTGKEGEIVPKDNNTTHFIIFNSNQAKSATENIGTFNPENPDIRWREADSEVKRAVDEWASNPENVRKLAEEYLAGQKGQIVVDPDRIRAKLPNYEVSLNSDFVEAGDKVLEEVWKESLKRAPKDKPVVLLTGNPAAGKGTAKETGLLDWVVEANLVFDAPQNKFTSVEKRVKEAVNAGHSVRIIQIYNDPITSWRNSLKRGIGKDNPKTGMREGGRFLPMEYFVGVYESAQGKVEKIETILKQKYQNKLETKYIDSTGNNPIVVSPDEAKAWDYSISDNQLKEIERITDEYRGRIEESARLRGDKKDPLAVIGRGISQSLAISLRGSAERISRRTESGDERAKQSLPGEGGEGRGPVSRLKALLRQERSENPVIWASIVLAREILLGRPITSAKIDKVLPQGKFDGTKRQYALDRAKRIAEKTKLTQKDFVRDLDRAVQKAESDIFWQEEFVENAYRAFSKGGEEYGFAKQKLLQYLKNMRNKELAKVKGYETDDFDFNLVEAIFKAQESEPKRVKPNDSTAEETEEFETSDGEFDADVEISGKKTPLAPAPIRDVVAKIRMEVAKRVRNADGTTKELNEKYRKTLVNILTDAAKELTYGRERELIQQNIRGLGNLAYHNVNSLRARAIELKNKRDLAEKDKSLKSDYIETYNNIQGIYFGTYSGRGGVMNYFVKNYLDNPSQIPDPYSIYAEHIALRIFNRGVRDTKAQLLERFGGIIKRKGKKPSRMERDDKRKMAGAVQMRIYKIGKFAEMDAAELEAEYFAAVDKLNNAGVHFAGDSDNGETNKDFTDIEDIRAEAANTIADIQRFGNLREKSRADMAGAVEFLEKHIEEEMQKQEELIAKKKEEAAKKRKVVSDALRMSKHNAHKDGAFRSGGRALINKTMPFDSLLAVLGEYATGETFLAFDAWRKDLVARIDRAAALVANETFRAQERLINIVEECYSENFSDALKRLLKPDPKYEEFSNLGGESEGMKQPISLANVLQLYASALQENYRQNVYAHRAKKNGDVEKLQMKIDEILESYPDKESKKGEGWKSASEEIKSLENRIAGLQKNAVSDYIERIEKVLTDADKKFVELLRKEYADALPALSAVSRRVIGLPIEQADALYIPAKIKREKTFGEAAGQVPVVPKILSPRVQHMRDFDETANPISLYLDRVRENAQFKYFSELYIEMRSIFGSEELQDLISQRCGSNTLQELLDFVVDISTGQTRGYKDEYIQKANGLFALVALGFNLGSGVRQILPGCFSWGTYIGTPSVLKNMAAFFTPEGFSAALEIWRSENGRRRFSIGNLQIMEEMLATPDQNKFWALFKRYALVFNRASDMLAISFVGQGVYRAGVENYLRQGFNEAKAKEKAMADMWQIAERTQASGRMHNMARWQRRGGDLGKGIGMFSAPPQLMFSKSAQDIRRAIALGIKTPEGRVAAWQALKTWATVSILVEGSYAASGVLWNALLKGFFDDDDDERIIKQMATGPFGGLFLFGRMIENSTSNRGIESIMPVAGLARPAGNIYDLTLDLMTFDLDKALEDLDKLGKSTVPLYRDFRKVIDNRILEEN